MTQKLHIEVAYAKPDEQSLIVISVPEGTSALQAVELSGLLKKYPEIDLAQNKLGIFGKLCKGDTILREKDRVEIYRPLIADPKEVRRQRAAEGKVTKKGGGDLTE